MGGRNSRDHCPDLHPLGDEAGMIDLGNLAGRKPNLIAVELYRARPRG
jgi:hypothetical protein